MRRQGEWCWYAGWGVLTREGGGCKPDFVWRSWLLLICGSGSCTWFLGRWWGLLAPCYLEIYSEAPIVRTFPCCPRKFAEFWMAAIALCSETSFWVFHIFSALGWMQEFTFLTCHAVSTRLVL